MSIAHDAARDGANARSAWMEKWPDVCIGLFASGIRRCTMAAHLRGRGGQIWARSI